MKCMLLPYTHTFSARDDTSFIYGFGTKKLRESLELINTKPLQVFWLKHRRRSIPSRLISLGKALMIRAAYGKSADPLTILRTKKFLKGKLGLFLSLPSIDDVLKQHMKRAA